MTDAVDAARLELEAAVERNRDAHDRVEKLHRLGPENGAGATIWARAIRDNVQLHEAARATHPNMPLDELERVYATAMLLLVAIDQVLGFEQRVRSLTGDAELQKARARFDRIGPDAGDLRDLVTHLDAYAIGEGDRQTGKGPPLKDGRQLEPLIYWGGNADGTPASGTIVSVAGQHLDLEKAASAALELAAVVERVRARWAKRADDEANDALRQLHARTIPGTHE